MFIEFFSSILSFQLLPKFYKRTDDHPVDPNILYQVRGQILFKKIQVWFIANFANTLYISQSNFSL